METESFIREGKRALLSMSHGVSAVVENKRVTDKLKHYDTKVIHNDRPAQINTCLFLITRMVRFSGGQTSILRLGTELTKLGIRVIYGVYKKQSPDEMKLCAAANLPGFQGELYTMEDCARVLKGELEQPDVVVASSWDTVFYAKKFKSYKMYFVQDYEPYFYSFGELYLMAKKTYEQGLHMVSLGKWNIDMIQKNCIAVSPLDAIDFPCDYRHYAYEERDFASYASKKTLVLAVYMKFYGKRLPCIVQYMMTELQDRFKKDGITLDVRYFGEAKSFQTKGGSNLGMLNHKELLGLYREADFGVVASMSNISLVPYEMLASGLPLVEFEDGTFSYFFPDNSAILTSIDPDDLYKQLRADLKEPWRLKERSDIAMAHIETLGWEKTGKQFYDIFQKIIKEK